MAYSLRSVVLQPMLAKLTKREQDVLIGILNGKTNKQMADESFVCVGAIKNHVWNLGKKLGAQTSKQRCGSHVVRLFLFKELMKLPNK